MTIVITGIDIKMKVGYNESIKEIKIYGKNIRSSKIRTW